MPTFPEIKVEIDFTSGPSFSYPFILDSAAFGILGTNILADGPLDLVDITDQVRKVSTRRGRNRLLSQFEAGTATVVLNDPNSDFSPENASSPYAGKLFPLRKIRIYANVQNGPTTVEVGIFAGYITSFDTSFYLGTNEDATVTLQCVDGFRLLSNVSTEIPPIPGATSGQLTGARIDTLLDFADWPTSMMQLDVGQTTCQVDPGGNRSVLQAVQTIEQTEFGAFFMGRNGIARFLDRDTVTKLANIPNPRSYTDTYPLPANEFPYSLVDFAYDDQLILNDISVQALGGAVFKNTLSPETQASIDRYSYKSASRTGLLMLDTTEAEDQANLIAASRRDANLRIDSMKLNLDASIDDANNLANLSLDIYSLINITKAMPGGSSITKELFVQGVNHDITPLEWNMTVYTAEPIIQAFILDSNTQGLLDTNALSY